MKRLGPFLTKNAKDGFLPINCQIEAMERFHLSYSQVEGFSLQAGFTPMRYQRNREIISPDQQLRIFKSKVAVIGCGGLGGYIIEQLARLGVGQIVAIDPDTFEEHNLNRQLLSSLQGIGESKAEIAAERVAEINPAVTVHPVRANFCKENGLDLLEGSDVAVDALDNIPARLQLADTCNEIKIPMVHGAIAGWYGYVATVFPGEDTMQKIYRNWVEGRGAEQQLGNPSFTPAAVASFEVAEVCKILLGKGPLLRGRKLSINLLDMEVEEVPL